MFACFGLKRMVRENNLFSPRHGLIGLQDVFSTGDLGVQ
jgi:hypothetical protein